MDERFAEHLEHPVGRGHTPQGAYDGSAGGAACGDLVRISVRVEGERVTDAGFDASGCGAIIASASAAVDLVRGESLFDAARVSTGSIAAELGGLSAGKIHAADLAADALHRAIGLAATADAKLAPSPDRTLVAMSGGVDSAVAALQTMKRVLPGHSPGASSPANGSPVAGDAVAVTLELWRDPENDGESSCCSASAVRVARAVAHKMGMAHFTLDLRDEFRDGVVTPWLEGHAGGETPNPCVRCNGQVRLDAMVAFADRLGAAKLATGHYARIGEDGLLQSAADDNKDQTYMLAGLSPATIARLDFPLGSLRKPEVREIARAHDVPVADRAESQDLCFLAGTGRERFLERHGRLGERPGDLVDRSGKVLGRHRGAHGFTVGQRRGIRIGGTPEPLYVLGTDARSNTVTVGSRAELGTQRVALRDLKLHVDASEIDAVKLRYRSAAVGCRIDGDDVVLDTPFEGAAPGQTAVLLRGDSVAGSATIAK